MLASKLTSKYQATVPLKVRELLDLKHGDRISFIIKNHKVILEKIPALDLEFTRSLEGTLGEWNSENDEEAYRDL